MRDPLNPLQDVVNVFPFSTYTYSHMMSLAPVLCVKVCYTDDEKVCSSYTPVDDDVVVLSGDTLTLIKRTGQARLIKKEVSVVVLRAVHVSRLIDSIIP